MENAMRNRAPHVWIYAIAVGLAVSGCGGTASSLPGDGASSSLPGGFSLRAQPPSGSSPIAHVVVIVQENRSFDNLFALFPGADGATQGKMKVKRDGKYQDKWTNLQSHTLVDKSDYSHCHSAFLTQYDGGKMDGFNLVLQGSCGTRGKPVGKAVYQYVEESQIQPYWDIALQWVLADHMFQTQGSGSFTAHQDLIRGGTQIDNKFSLVDNPQSPTWGCDSGPNTRTSLITKGNRYLPYQDKGPFPCTNQFPSSSYYETIRDLLDAKGISWKYYSPCFKGWNPYNCDGGCPTLCSGARLNAFDVIASVRYGPEWGTNVSMPETNIFSDISGGTLPAVSWVIPSDANSDHPGELCGCDDGPSWVASVVNAVGGSSYWSSSAIVVLWDDWGGFYDHVAPQQMGFGGLGFRVPMMILSPYAKMGSSSQGGYISSTPYESGSILRYIEDNWNLPRLGTSDVRAASIGDVFDYTQPPRAFTQIPSEDSIEYFKHVKMTPQHGDPE
jgi:phospholipase C